jgi:hypothetical protein
VRRLRVAAVLCGALLVPAAGAAQLGSFGENKIQYHAFDWRVLRGAHVDLYHYPEAEELARVALAYAEESYGVLQLRFKHGVGHRVPLIIYASHSDFEQTNVLPFVPPEGLLGVTEFLKERVALPFNGSYADFRHTIRHELTHVFQLAVTEAALERYPRVRHVSFPLWWTEGLAEFWSAGEDTRDQMVLRDITVSGRLPSLEALMDVYGAIVYPVGSAIHRFLAERYGEWRITAMYEDLWKYQLFEDEVRAVYGRSLSQLSEEWRHWMRQRFYPAVQAAEPLTISSHLVSSLAVKPTVVRLPGDSTPTVLYFSPFTGYTNIYARDVTGGRLRSVVKGERTAQFESFHFFESRLDVSSDGVVVFGSKYLERDALFFWSIPKGRVVGRYQFPQLISILSPAWAPDGKSVVFSGLAVSGYSDLYRLWLPDGRLEALTTDRYQDLDPCFSPDGKRIVFSSDRTTFGPHGGRNLFRLDLATGGVDYLTYGDWHDDQPRWSRETGRIYFSSDRDGTFQIYSIDSTGAGRLELRSLNGAFDPQWVDEEHGLVFGGFANLTFDLYMERPTVSHDAAPPAIQLAAERAPAAWAWPELQNATVAQSEATPYGHKYSMDFAAGSAVATPGIGTAQGAVFVFSDMLSDHQVVFSLSSFQAAGYGNLLDNVNGSVFYLNQAQRVNWGMGAFRLRGVFTESDFTTLYQETSTGVLGQLRYPLSRYRRIEAQYTVEYSDRLDLTPSYTVYDQGFDFHRVGWIASSYLTYVKDNTLWLATGPIDGVRFNFTGGLANDLTHGRFDSWVIAGDYRSYLRTSLRSAIALRLLGYYAGGERPRPVNIGGPWALRGYPMYGYVAGNRVWLVNAEWRSPITDFLSIGFPFGEARFPGVQGALFVDAGRAWSGPDMQRGLLGSAGFGLRMPIGAPLVLRLDFGYRFHSGSLVGYGLPANTANSRFVIFFFGFNY